MSTRLQTIRKDMELQDIYLEEMGGGPLPIVIQQIATIKLDLA